VGLVLARLLGVEPFFMEFIGGIEERLTSRDLSVLLHIVADHSAEIAAHRRWAARGLVAVRTDHAGPVCAASTSRPAGPPPPRYPPCGTTASSGR
jgi:DNA-binding LacI/PurR family transcriptional regulator